MRDPMKSSRSSTSSSILASSALISSLSLSLSLSSSSSLHLERFVPQVEAFLSSSSFASLLLLLPHHSRERGDETRRAEGFRHYIVRLLPLCSLLFALCLFSSSCVKARQSCEAEAGAQGEVHYLFFPRVKRFGWTIDACLRSSWHGVFPWWILSLGLGSGSTLDEEEDEDEQQAQEE
mmetsp:Transcript_5344/g.16150  ORF Transcript_5344/g.16150 Transcript_5344/m.16150 type:complete len:178 (+) Transcript_5344:157-690(+)